MLEFVQALITSITGAISMTAVASVVAAIIAAFIVPQFAWKFGRKGFNAIRNALSGKSGKI